MSDDAPAPHSRSQHAILESYYQKLEASLPPLQADARLVEITTADSLSEDCALDPGQVRLVAPQDIGMLGDDFGAESLDGIIMIDQLSRVESPAHLFEQAEKCLKPGGRLAMIEPGVSLLSWIGYGLTDDRRIDFRKDPMISRSGSSGRPGNLAVTSHLFNFLEHRINFMERFRRLHCVHQAWLSILAAPLSRGIAGYSLLPESFVHPMLALEDSLMPFIGRWSASKLVIVIEKRREPPAAD